MTLLRILVLACVSALLLGGVAGAAGPTLLGSVGPGFAIALVDASGNSVTHLDPGAVSLTVDDKAADHNFHLTGPGVDVATTLDEIAVKTFSLNLVDGRYAFVCDAHPTLMASSFTVGTPPAQSTPPPTPSSPTKQPTRLLLTLTGSAISLTTPAGTSVKSLAAGSAVITVHDRSATRGVRLSGAGVSRSTSATFVGTVVWKVKLSTGTIHYESNAKKPLLRGGVVKVS